MLLHFRLGAQPPFLVLKPQPRAQTSISSNPPTGDSKSLVLQPQHSMQVRRGCCILDNVYCRYRRSQDCDSKVILLYYFLWTPGEGGLPLLPVPSGSCRAGGWGSLSRGDADPQCKWREEAEVPAKPPDSLQQQQPAGQTCFPCVEGERRKWNNTVWSFVANWKIFDLSALRRQCLSVPIWLSLRCVCPLTASTLGSATWGRHRQKKWTSTATEPTHTGNHS